MIIKDFFCWTGSRWKVTDLTYKITKYPTRLTKEQVDIDVERAFKVRFQELEIHEKMGR